MRCYIFPVKIKCNANCKFCFTKDISNLEFKKQPPMISLVDFSVCLKSLQQYQINEVEITGGGEPTLHPDLPRIIEMFREEIPNVYIKMYSNGFYLRDLPRIDEVNISRCHWDTAKNNEIYRTKTPNDLQAVIDHYKNFSSMIRIQSVLLKGYIDTTEKMIEMVDRFPDVNIFMFRPLFSKCDREKDKFVDLTINYPRVKMDITGDNYKNCVSIDTSGNINKNLPWNIGD